MCGAELIAKGCTEYSKEYNGKPNPVYEKAMANVLNYKRIDEEENIDKLMQESYKKWLNETSGTVVEDVKDQEAKADDGKPILSLVPTEIIYEIEKVRRFAQKKYKDANSWKRVEIERYHQALLRHTLAVWDDITARDKESGLLHLSHIATNVAFILEMLKDKE
jgi:hypothetical protein